MSTFAVQYADSMAEAAGSLVCVMDRDRIIAAAGNGKKNYDGKPISRKWSSLLKQEVVRWRMHRRKIARN